MLERAIREVVRRSYKRGLFYVRSRGELPYILNVRRLVGEGAEIGVHKGSNSEYLLSYWKGNKLYSIDSWLESERDVSVEGICVTQSEHDAICVVAREKLARFGARSAVVRQSSRSAAAMFKDGQLDFVYIDALHYYEDVSEDIALWFPKVRKGGIFAGHDYLDGGTFHYAYGVKSAVDEFKRASGLRLTVSRERDWPSWFFIV